MSGMGRIAQMAVDHDVVVLATAVNDCTLRAASFYKGRDIIELQLLDGVFVPVLGSPRFEVGKQKVYFIDRRKGEWVVTEMMEVVHA